MVVGPSTVEGVVNVVRRMSPDPAFWRGRRVLLTGHTGFKGAWLGFWLAELGAELHGVALDPPSQPNLYTLCGLSGRFASDTRADLRNAAAVRDCVAASRPEIVLHLAAQSLVRPAYSDPVATFATNVLGTAHVLEAARNIPGVRAVLVVTSDKCYDNREWIHPYRECDPLGGHDPYSASKAAAELVTASWRASFAGDCGTRIASARAGNVIGAGDWAAERLLPDCYRAFVRGDAVRLRNPQAVRPWQHVLEPLAGYLLLSERLHGEAGSAYARAWNFGPDSGGEATVAEVAELAASLWGAGAKLIAERCPGQPHEAGTLRLDSTQARVLLGWSPRWSLEQSIAATGEGYRLHAEGGDLSALLRAQLAKYLEPGHLGDGA